MNICLHYRKNKTNKHTRWIVIITTIKVQVYPVCRKSIPLN